MRAQRRVCEVVVRVSDAHTSSLARFLPRASQCKSLIHAQEAHHGNVVQPQPHGSFLVRHLAALPPNHVLKLLCRHHTLWGEILESIVTLCLVRDAAGQPDFILLLSTPVRRSRHGSAACCFAEWRPTS